MKNEANQFSIDYEMQDDGPDEIKEASSKQEEKKEDEQQQ